MLGQVLDLMRVHTDEVLDQVLCQVLVYTDGCAKLGARPGTRPYASRGARSGASAYRQKLCWSRYLDMC